MEKTERDYTKLMDTLYLHQINYKRACEVFFKDRPMTNAALILKLTEELGELAAAHNKVERGFSPHILRSDYSTDQEYDEAQAKYVEGSKANFGTELGQVYLLLSQLATHNGLNLEALAAQEFNKVSKEIKYSIFY